MNNLVLFLSLSCSLALRFPVAPEESLLQGAETHLPKLKTTFEQWSNQIFQVGKHDFEKPWAQNALRDTRHKIIMLIPTSLGDNKWRRETGMTYREARDQHRNTWMQLPGMCKLESAAKPGCIFFPMFVIGATNITEEERFRTGIDQSLIPMPGAEEEHELHHDMIFLHGENENMRSKTFALFEYAARAYPWAEYIMKMDIDTFPLPARLLNRLPEINKAQKWKDKAHSCPHKFLGDGKQAGKWMEHGGSMYVLSYSLANATTTAHGWWERNRKIDHEDLTTSLAIQHFVQKSCESAYPADSANCAPNKKYAIPQTRENCVSDRPKIRGFIPEHPNPEIGNLNGYDYIHAPWSFRR